MKKLLKLTLLFGMSLVFAVGCSAAPFELTSADLSRYVTLGDYKALEVTVSPKEEVTDEDVQAEYDSKAQEIQEGGEPITEGTVKDGDTVNIDYEGKKDGVPFDGGTAQGYDLTIGSGTFIPGFEEGLIGVNVGDTVDLDLTFPEDYGTEELAGQAVVFTVTVNHIANPIEELTDANASDFYEDCKTLDEVKTRIREEKEKDAQENYDNALNTALLNKLLEVSEFKDTPQDFADAYADLWMAEITRIAEGYGMAYQSYAANVYGMPTEAFREQIKQTGVTSAQQAIACQAIANAEGITVSEEEINAASGSTPEEGESANGLEELLIYSGDSANIRTGLMIQKVEKKLAETAKITEEEPEEETAEDTAEDAGAAETDGTGAADDATAGETEGESADAADAGAEAAETDAAAQDTATDAAAQDAGDNADSAAVEEAGAEADAAAANAPAETTAGAADQGAASGTGTAEEAGAPAAEGAAEAAEEPAAQ